MLTTVLTIIVCIAAGTMGTASGMSAAFDETNCRSGASTGLFDLLSLAKGFW
jgi:hypothetical protein